MTPVEAIEHYVEQHSGVQRVCVAYSGGIDSHVLLALIARLHHKRGGFRLRALHIDHGLQLDSILWAEHAADICSELGVPLEVRKCDVEVGSQGPEAAARRARYRAFADSLFEDEHLLLAQHQDDQAETFLLQALRGSGPDGLSAIPAKRLFARGEMVRPLLACTQQSIVDSANELNLEWIEDTSNKSSDFDRNYLRLEIMPLIKQRWPSAAQTLSRSSSRSAAASRVLLNVAMQDLDGVRVDDQAQLSLSALRSLPLERCYTAIRLWVRQHELPMPRLQDLVQVHNDLINAKYDSNGIVNVREYQFRRHRDSLCLTLPEEQTEPFFYVWKAPYKELLIAETGTSLTLQECEQQGLVLPLEAEVIVKSREGGELIKIGDPAYHKSVKKIFQESLVPPWQRISVPLVYVNDTLAAVWQLAIAVDYKQPLVDEEAEAESDAQSVTS